MLLSPHNMISRRIALLSQYCNHPLPHSRVETDVQLGLQQDSYCCHAMQKVELGGSEQEGEGVPLSRSVELLCCPSSRRFVHLLSQTHASYPPLWSFH